MTFTIVNLVFVTIAVSVALQARRLRGRPVEWRPYLIALVVLFALTTVFDNLMIAAGLFDYGTEHRTGILIGRAPIEDYAYPLAAVILLPAVWQLFGGDER
ncbi:lycopene cyclase domain-containing protein [Actinomycetota bacterium]